MRRRLALTLVALAALTAAAVPGGTIAVAAGTGAPTAGTSGHDISWPQCSASYPQGGSFGIVGVTDGRAWSTNPCLSSEYRWAAAYPRTPDLYMNTANPAPHSSYYWPAQAGVRDPALCQDPTVTTDPGCAYDYGWHTAADALATAKTTLGTQAQGVWWLDVETGNTWNGDTWANAADIQGSIDYLLSQQVAGVGVYSTQYQWSTITGGYSASNASSYAAIWQPEFTSPNGIAGSPSWVAGASSASDAASFCANSFLGTTTWMAQYISGGFDVDYACGSGGPPPPQSSPDYSIGVPGAVNGSSGSTVQVTVTLTSAGGWSGTVALSVKAPSQVTSSLSPASVSIAPNSSVTVTLNLRSKSAGRYTVTVVGQPRPGSTTTTTHTASLLFAVGQKPGLTSAG